MRKAVVKIKEYVIKVNDKILCKTSDKDFIFSQAKRYGYGTIVEEHEREEGGLNYESSCYMCKVW